MEVKWSMKVKERNYEEGKEVIQVERKDRQREENMQVVGMEVKRRMRGKGSYSKQVKE